MVELSSFLNVSLERLDTHLVTCNGNPCSLRSRDDSALPHRGGVVLATTMFFSDKPWTPTINSNCITGSNPVTPPIIIELKAQNFFRH